MSDGNFIKVAQTYWWRRGKWVILQARYKDRAAAREPRWQKFEVRGVRGIRKRPEADLTSGMECTYSQERGINVEANLCKGQFVTASGMTLDTQTF